MVNNAVIFLVDIALSRFSFKTLRLGLTHVPSVDIRDALLHVRKPNNFAEL